MLGTPLLVDLKPSRRFLAADMHRAGGVRLLARGKHFPPAAKTVTGLSITAISESAVENPGREVIAPMERPLKKAGGIGRPGRAIPPAYLPSTQHWSRPVRRE